MKSIAICLFSNKSNIGQAYFSSKCRNRFVKAYSQLEKNEVIDCGLDNRFVILAYSQKLKIK